MLEQGFLFFSIGSHSSPFPSSSRKAIRSLNTLIHGLGRVPFCPTTLGGAGGPVRETHSRARRGMHPRSSVSLRVKEAAPIQHILVYRRCPVLASARSSPDERVKLVRNFTLAPLTGAPRHHGPNGCSAGVEFLDGDQDYRRHRIARDRMPPV